MTSSLTRAVAELQRLSRELEPLLKNKQGEYVVYPNHEQGELLQKDLPLLQKNIRAAMVALNTIILSDQYGSVPDTGCNETIKNACTTVSELRLKYSISEYKGKMGLLTGLTSTINSLLGRVFYVPLEEDSLDSTALVRIAEDADSFIKTIREKKAVIAQQAQVRTESKSSSPGLEKKIEQSPPQMKSGEEFDTEILDEAAEEGLPPEVELEGSSSGEEADEESSLKDAEGRIERAEEERLCGKKVVEKRGEDDALLAIASRGLVPEDGMEKPVADRSDMAAPPNKDTVPDPLDRSPESDLRELVLEEGDEQDVADRADTTVPRWVGRGWGSFTATEVGGNSVTTGSKFKTIVNHWERWNQNGCPHVIVEGLRLCLVRHIGVHGEIDYKEKAIEKIEEMSLKDQFDLYVLAKSQRGFRPENRCGRVRTSDLLFQIIERSAEKASKGDLKEYLLNHEEYSQGYEEIRALMGL